MFARRKLSYRSFQIVAAISLVSVSVALAAKKESGGPSKKFAPPRAVDVGSSMQRLVEADWIDCDRRFATRDLAVPGAGPILGAAGRSTGVACDGSRRPDAQSCDEGRQLSDLPAARSASPPVILPSPSDVW